VLEGAYRIAGLAMQGVQDYSRDSENEEGRKEKPLSQLVLQFAAIHVRTRLRAQRHRGERWGRGANPTRQACTESTGSRSSLRMPTPRFSACLFELVHKHLAWRMPELFPRPAQTRRSAAEGSRRPE
jgi:hypothetical protein